MRRIMPAIAIVLLAAACGGDSHGPAPNATFTGPIATQPGVSGEIGFVISESGDDIVSANLGVRFGDFDCGPNATPMTVPGVGGEGHTVGRDPLRGWKQRDLHTASGHRGRHIPGTRILRRVRFPDVGTRDPRHRRPLQLRGHPHLDRRIGLITPAQ